MTEKLFWILFDGYCNLCNQWIDFIIRRDTRNQFRFLSLQDEKLKIRFTEIKIPENIDTVILTDGKNIYTESDAVLKILSLLKFPWNWLLIFKIFPKPFRDRIYRWIARNRYRWFGKREFCRFIDLPD